MNLRNKSILLDLIEANNLFRSEKEKEQSSCELDFNNKYVSMIIIQIDELISVAQKGLSDLKTNIEESYCYTLLVLEMIANNDKNLSDICNNILKFFEDETVILDINAVTLLKTSFQLFANSEIVNMLLLTDNLINKYKTCIQHEKLKHKLLILNMLARLYRVLLLNDFYTNITNACPSDSKNTELQT